MSKFKRYERYKDSGVEWIGEIPEEWNVKKGRYFLTIYGGYAPDLVIESQNGIDYYKVDDLNQIGRQLFLECAERKIDITEEVKPVKPPVILIPKRGAAIFTNKVRISNNVCIFDSNVMGIKSGDKADIKYVSYSLLSRRLDDIADVSSIPQINNKHINVIYFPYPSIEEQTAIANFLDQKTAEIDGLIADKEKLIELLQEKRQAIITEAVTKGLNPNVRMKDSGIEWIGEIPEHWEVKKLKHVSNITMGQSPKSEECSYDEIGVPFLQGNAEFTNVHPIPKMYCNTANKFSKVNDILLSVRAPVGAINISDRVYGIGRGLCAITAKKVIMKYLWYSLNVSLEELFIKSKGSTFEAVTVTDVQNLLIILPPKNEQDDIVNFLDKKTAEIDGLVIEIKKQIEKLKEYRQSLISEAVTGKIYVRDYAID